MTRWLWVALLALGCNKSDPEVEEFDPFDGLVAMEDCDEFDGYLGAGATSYWVGAFEIFDNGDVEGHEWWVLFPNDTWRESEDPPPEDEYCVITWEAAGVSGEPEFWGTADFSISVTADVVDDESTCPWGLYLDSETYGVTYDVQLTSDGEATFYFAGSGNKLADGEGDASFVHYTTQWGCRWF